MALLLFDPKSLTLNVQAGILENYEPSEDAKEIAKKVEELKAKAKVKQDELNEIYKKFAEAELDPAIKEIQDKVMKINTKKYPELEKLVKKPEVK